MSKAMHEGITPSGRGLEKPQPPAKTRFARTTTTTSTSFRQCVASQRLRKFKTIGRFA